MKESLFIRSMLVSCGIVFLLTGCSVIEKKASSTTAIDETASYDKLTLHLKFDTDQAVIKEDDFKNVNAAIDFIRKYPAASVIIAGHTDNAGSKDYNHTLSHQRAEAVKKYIIVHSDIDASIIKTIGYGESRPVASNDTEEGRFQNRRVEILVKPGN